MSSGWKKARRLSGKCVGCEGVGCEGVGCEGVGSYSICVYALFDTCVSYDVFVYMIHVYLHTCTL